MVVALSLARTAQGDTITNPFVGCHTLSSLPESWVVSAGSHIEFNFYSDATKGCHPSPPGARPTHGAVSFDFLSDGSERLTFFKNLIEPCGSHQGDFRLTDSLGNITLFADTLIDTERDCVVALATGAQGVENPSEVPEPSALFLMMLGLIVLLTSRGARW
jgi:hypothetical protein